MSASQIATVHGVFMSVFGVGTLITGKSGVGKSDLALSLVERGHAFIADDMVEFSSDGLCLLGRSPPLLKNFLEIRGLGVLDITVLFGAEALCEEKPLSLVVQLEQLSLVPRNIAFNSTPWSLLGVTVPAFSLPVCEKRPREVLLEVLVRRYQQTQHGYDASRHFLDRHHQALGVSA